MVADLTNNPFPAKNEQKNNLKQRSAFSLGLGFEVRRESREKREVVLPARPPVTQSFYARNISPR